MVEKVNSVLNGTGVGSCLNVAVEGLYLTKNGMCDTMEVGGDELYCTLKIRFPIPESEGCKSAVTE